LESEDESAYARGVREGAAAFLDENEAWNQNWRDPLLTLLGTHPSRTLGKNLEKSGQPRPSEDYDDHHLAPWRHWRAHLARDILEKWDIPIDAIENGMWLERTFHRSLSNNYKYMERVTRMLEQAKSKPQVLEVLKRIKESLSRKRIP
jgi:hypothetical protein